MGDAAQPGPGEPATENYGGVQLPPLPPPPPDKKRRASRVRSVRLVILLIFLLIAGLGWLVRTVREAHATPKDKAACSAVLSAVQTNGQTAVPMMTALGSADDQTLRTSRQDMLNDSVQRNDAKFVDDLNHAIKRCRDISSDFRSGFHDYCQSHSGACKQGSNFNPF